jgi:Ribosomal protein L7/L12
MSLINCPECNREISDKAESCPHCGYPFKNSESVDNKSNTYTLNNKNFDISDVLYEISRGNNIIAIKKFREKTGTGLYEAKTIVDCLTVNQNDFDYDVKCPTCGCKDYEITKRKRSILTGFIKNNVAYECRNCKTIF